MRGMLSPILGALSVLVFVGLAGFLVYDAVEGQEAVVEEPRGTGPHPLEGFGPEDLPATPFTLGEEVEVRNLLDEVTVDCSSGAPRLRLRATEELPAGTNVRISVHAAGVPRPSGMNTYPHIGEPQLASLSDSTDGALIALSPSILTVDAAPLDAELLMVYVSFREPDGRLIESNVARLPFADVRCGGTS